MKRSIFGLIVLSSGLFLINRFGYMALRSFNRPSKAQIIDDKVKIMTFNLENLFDSLDDPNKNDETYLPLSKKKTKAVIEKCQASAKPHWVKQCLNTNWTNLKIEKKMRRIAKVVRAYSPDILFVQEVENVNVLNRLNSEHLNFNHTVLLEGEDKRGIDVAILTNLPLHKDAKIHSQSTSKWSKPTRGILNQDVLLPDGTVLSLFAVHFPSQGSPTKARINGLEVLSKVSKNKNSLKVVAGDFNVTENEEYIYDKILSSNWKISHKIGCEKCKGTYYYHPKRSWSFFDVFLFSKEFDKHPKWFVDTKTINVFNTLPIQNSKWNTPERFNGGENKNGVSDHWPLVVTLQAR